jgi:hypothetical protein
MSVVALQQEELLVRSSSTAPTSRRIESWRNKVVKPDSQKIRVSFWFGFAFTAEL